MAHRLPTANLFAGKYTDSQLISRAQQVHDGITADPFAIFTTPPVLMVDLQSSIDGYRSASAAAIKGSKADTVAKNNAKLTLILQLKQLSIYVSQVSSANYDNSPVGYEITRQNIISSGFLVSFSPIPVSPVNGIQTPKVRRAISEASGTLKILIRQYTNANRNTLLYQVQYRTSATTNPVAPAGDWQTQTFTGQNEILLTGLTSGLSYDWQIGAIGGRDIKRNNQPPVNYTPIASAVII